MSIDPIERWNLAISVGAFATALDTSARSLLITCLMAIAAFGLGTSAVVAGAAVLAVARQLRGQHWIGLGEGGAECLVERLQAAHAVEVGVLEAGNAQGEVPGARLLPRIIG